MEYDYGARKNTGGAGTLPYDPHLPMYRYPSSTSSSSSSLYPKIGQRGFSPPSRAPPYHSSSAPPSSSGTGIRVQIKPEYRITPPPPLLPHMGDVPHSKFQFDFDFERNLLAEAEKENPNWSRFASENVPSRTSEPMPSVTQTPAPAPAPTVDPVVSKYIASGLNREAVPLAVANFGDNPTKVREFSNAYTLLREMGFPSNNVAEALLMFDNDTDKALAHFLNSSS